MDCADCEQWEVQERDAPGAGQPNGRPVQLPEFLHATKRNRHSACEGASVRDQPFSVQVAEICGIYLRILRQATHRQAPH